MKTYFKILSLGLLINTILFSCTEVIDVDVPTGTPRLVVEASIDWERGTDGKEQIIKLSMMTPYFSQNEQNAVTGAEVLVKDLITGNLVEFTDLNNGNYRTEEFIPVFEHEYELTIHHNGKIYLAKETLMPVSQIQSVDQSIDGGFNSEDIEVNLHFTDPKNEDNYYLFKFNRIGDQLPTLSPISDEFTDGNVMKESFEKTDDEDTDEEEELKQGDVVDYEMHSISERYYNYMQILVNQLGGGGLFQGVPVELKGNCINIKDESDFTLGYFRLTESVKGTYIIE